MATLLLFIACLSQTLGAAPRQPDSAPPVSLDRIRKEVEKRPAIKLEVRSEQLPAGKPVATFRTNVDERVYMLPFLDYLRKEFELSDIQRQSQEWRSKCCGINLLALPKIVKRAGKANEAANAREQVARELAELEASRKK